MVLKIFLIVISISMLSFLAHAGEVSKTGHKKVVIIDFSEEAVQKGPHISPEDSIVIDAQSALEARMLASVEQSIPE